MRTQLSAILDAVAELSAGGHLPAWSPPRTPPESVAAAARPDEVTPLVRRREKALANAPAKVGTSFAVPKIIE